MKLIQYREETLFPREGWPMTEQITDTQHLLMREAVPVLQGIPKHKKVLLRLDEHSYPDGRVKVSLRISEYWFDRWDVVWLLVLIVLAIMFHFLQP